ncbi:MAG: Tungsten-containing aldehyde ferredoxin oxidoreductase [Methanocella sp. PtaU1.Bin125]|nr:MAG: Tungsten-containing aldehyde ferredoxin oxidoreductase [Methanocella sp. PtaU1.Bin125]
MNGYMDKILFVDLSKNRLEIKPFPDELKRNYLGGRGLGIKILADALDSIGDPLDESNVLIFATGPLTGSGVPLGSRYSVITKSPLTGTATSADSGGSFGWKMKKAGFDAVVISGKAKAPVYLYLKDGAAELRNAAGLWGKTTSETTAAIMADVGDSGAKVACIGPAGEKLSRLACVMNDRFRAAGRGGTGAVMGSKNLKAIAASGDLKIEVADPARVKALQKALVTKHAENGIAKALHDYGTAVLVNIINENYILPTNNFQGAHFPAADKVSGETLAKTILKKPKGCHSCTILCGRGTLVDGVETEGPEYETTWAFGPDCGVDDLMAIKKANDLCNELGIDTIGTGATIACAMEMSQRGYISEKIKFGDGAAVVELVRKMGYREGIGDEMADGSYRFAEKYGHSELSMSVKRQEMPAYDARGLQGHGLEYATSVRGGCHVYGYMVSPEVLGSPEKLDPYVDKDKARWTKTFQDLTATIDAAGICLFSSFAMGAPDYADSLSAVTGFPVDDKEVLKIGERIWNLQKLINLKLGFTRADDTLPKRLLEEPLAEGGPKGRVWSRTPLLNEYYRERGWDIAGRPMKAKLEELGLEAMAPVPFAK